MALRNTPLSTFGFTILPSVCIFIARELIPSARNVFPTHGVRSRDLQGFPDRLQQCPNNVTEIGTQAGILHRRRMQARIRDIRTRRCETIEYLPRDEFCSRLVKGKVTDARLLICCSRFLCTHNACSQTLVGRPCVH